MGCVIVKQQIYQRKSSHEVKVRRSKTSRNLQVECFFLKGTSADYLMHLRVKYSQSVLLKQSLNLQFNIGSFQNKSAVTNRSIPSFAFLLLLLTNLKKCFYKYNHFLKPLIFQSKNHRIKDKLQWQEILVYITQQTRCTHDCQLQALQWHFCSNLQVITDRWLPFILQYGG